MKRVIGRYLELNFVRFVIVGLISAAIEYSLYFALTTVLHYQVANVLSFALTNVVTFVLSRKYVFASGNQNKAEEATLFILCLLGALIVSQGVLSALVEYGNINDKIAKAFAICVAVIWNYFTRKHIVFRKREASEPVAVTEPVEEKDPD